MQKHLVIPDLQIKPGTPVDHLRWIGKYIVEKKPDVIVQLGDFADMESLSSYDKGKLQFEGRRYKEDIWAAKNGNKVLLKPLNNFNKKKRKNKEKQYHPRMVLTLGNHENRIVRATENSPEYDGLMSLNDLEYEEAGWEVIPFLEVVEIDGLAYAHYFYNQQSGRPYAGYSIDTRLKNICVSFVQGHQQVYLCGTKSLNNGNRIRGLVCGNCYLHDEGYRGPQGNSEWRGIFILHEVEGGDYSLLEVSLDFLCRRYEGMSVAEFMKINYPEIYAESAWMRRK